MALHSRAEVEAVAVSPSRKLRLIAAWRPDIVSRRHPHAHPSGPGELLRVAMRLKPEAPRGRHHHALPVRRASLALQLLGEGASSTPLCSRTPSTTRRVDPCDRSCGAPDDGMMGPAIVDCVEARSRAAQSRLSELTPREHRPPRGDRRREVRPGRSPIAVLTGGQSRGRGACDSIFSKLNLLRPTTSAAA